MKLPSLPAAGEDITEVWGRQVIAFLRSLLPQSTNTVVVCRTPSGTTWQAKAPRALPSGAAVAGPEFDFWLESNGDGTYAEDGTYNMNGTWQRTAGWILTPQGPVRGAADASALDDSDFLGGTAETPKIVYLELTPPAMHEGECKVATLDAFAALDASLLRVPLAEIGMEGEGADALPTVFRYCRPVWAVSYNAPEEAP